MRVMGIVLCLLAAAGCGRDRPRSTNPDLRRELSRTHEQLGGGMALLAATVVEGGGVRTANRKQPQVVLDVSKEFAGQFIAPGRVTLGKQHATFRIIASSQREEERDFDIPANGTRIIAFGDPTGSSLVVYANHVFADTDTNRAAATLGRGPAASQAYETPLFLGALGFAFSAIFLAWSRVKVGLIALAASIALWLGYEATGSRQAIRIDLLILVPVVLAATISVGIAAARGVDKPGKPRQPRRRHSGR